jgi:hypothetical protein
MSNAIEAPAEVDREDTRNADAKCQHKFGVFRNSESWRTPRRKSWGMGRILAEIENGQLALQDSKLPAKLQELAN